MNGISRVHIHPRISFIFTEINFRKLCPIIYCICCYNGFTTEPFLFDCFVRHNKNYMFIINHQSFFEFFFNKQKISMLFHQDLNFVSSVLLENKCYHNCIQGVISNAYNLSKCVIIIKSTFVSGWHPSLYNHPLQRVEQFFLHFYYGFLIRISKFDT